MMIDKVLLKTINLRRLFSTNPELFDFSSLKIEERMCLLEYDYKKFSSVKGITEFTREEKIFIIINSLSLSTFGTDIDLTEEELLKIDDNIYIQLLQRNFNKFINKEKFKLLGIRSQREIFSTQPDWVVKNIEDLPKLSSNHIEVLSKVNVNFVDAHFVDIFNCSTTYTFWRNMIRYNKKYKKIFIENTNSLVDKTHVRWVVSEFKDTIKLLTAENIYDSKLTIKEWLNLIYTETNSQDQSTKKLFKNWKFSKEMSEIIKLDLMNELLTGKSKLSKRLQKNIELLLDAAPAPGVSEELGKTENEDKTVE